MYSLIFLLIACCTAVFYFSSNKNKTVLTASWAQTLLPHRKAWRAGALLLLIVLSLLVCTDLGVVSGICTYMAMLMTALSLWVILPPYRLLKWKQLSMLWLAALILELSYTLMYASK